MRINAGNYKFRKIVLPEDIRPTTEKVREAICSMVMDHIPGANVLDLFAGSGVLGLEALSRGAAHCWFNDLSRKHIAFVRENIANCRAESVSSVSNKDFRKCLASLTEPMDIILLDPPYRDGLYEEALEKIMEYQLLAEDGVIVAEHLYELPLPEEIAGLKRIKLKKYGTIGVDIYIMASPEDEPENEGEAIPAENGPDTSSDEIRLGKLDSADNR